MELAVEIAASAFEVSVLMHQVYFPESFHYGGFVSNGINRIKQNKMDYKVMRPPQQLADYVRFIWFLETDVSTDRPFIHHAFAHHCPEVLFCYKGQFRHQSGFKEEQKLISGVYGQTHTFSKVVSNAAFGIFGFYLYPYAFTQLFSVPANELTNQSVDIKTLCGKEGEILEEKMMLATNNDHRLTLVCDFLEARLKNIRTAYNTICASIKAISNAYTEISVRSLAETNFLSLRQFERRFKELSGFSPQLFLRIAKFNSLLGKAFQNKSLTDIAYEYGYYDPAHFTHDFQKFSNQTPKAYFNAQTISASDRGTVDFEI
ncbi:helix-turn-helix transcriptional regulator [Niabella sp. CC-SYL272]|uniref:helix-turn-helix transcriptional regulator n=1 Tax=Niabella agricola TaxID=2891571 RepID=UPI001F401D8A|nr:helix-turn-helix transcriptional regulator [Niabella agricola]MCF3108141.1 helix-turn-helix transcriptional regulator [Niabella agricola]